MPADHPPLKALVFGGSGMLGHVLASVLAERFDTFISLREPISRYGHALSRFHNRHIDNFNAGNFDSVVRAFIVAQPDVVINCIGVVKQLPGAQDALESIAINSLFPHRVAALCQATGTRFITISTDCVFSGERGNYAESDKPDPEDLYGHTKLLGEVAGENCLTIRTSIVGRQLYGSYGLVEWFLSQKGKTVPGFKNMIFSGLTTRAISEILLTIIKDHRQLSGLWHLASEPISKYDLLQLIKQTAGLDITIMPDESKVLNRSLNGNRLKITTGIKVPAWTDMIKGMFEYAEVTSGR